MRLNATQVHNINFKSVQSVIDAVEKCISDILNSDKISLQRHTKELLNKANGFVNNIIRNKLYDKSQHTLNNSVQTNLNDLLIQINIINKNSYIPDGPYNKLFIAIGQMVKNCLNSYGIKFTKTYK